MKRLFIIFLLFASIVCQGQSLIDVIADSDVLADPYGPEKIADGTFTDTDNWVEGANWTLMNPGMAYDDLDLSNMTQHYNKMVTNIEINKTYRFEFNISIASGNANFKIINYANNEIFVDYADYANGYHALQFDTDGDIDTGGFGVRANNADCDNAFTFYNWSLKEVL